MIVCGMEMKSSEVRLVILNGSKAQNEYVDVKPRKLVLADDENGEEVRAFQDALYAFLRENNVQLIAIKKRGKVGTYAGGSVGFKLEAIAQLYGDCPARLVSPLSITAVKRKNTTVFPHKFPKYQEAAFETAFTALP